MDILAFLPFGTLSSSHGQSGRKFSREPVEPNLSRAGLRH